MTEKCWFSEGNQIRRNINLWRQRIFTHCSCRAFYWGHKIPLWKERTTTECQYKSRQSNNTSNFFYHKRRKYYTDIILSFLKILKLSTRRKRCLDRVWCGQRKSRKDRRKFVVCADGETRTPMPKGVSS